MNATLAPPRQDLARLRAQIIAAEARGDIALAARLFNAYQAARAIAVPRDAREDAPAKARPC